MSNIFSQDLIKAQMALNKGIKNSPIVRFWFAFVVTLGVITVFIGIIYFVLGILLTALNVDFSNAQLLSVSLITFLMILPIAGGRIYASR